MNNNVTDQELSQAVGQELVSFVGPLLLLMDAKLDKRLVRTLRYFWGSWFCTISWYLCYYNLIDIFNILYYTELQWNT